MYLEEDPVFGDPLEGFDEVGVQAEVIPKPSLHHLPREQGEREQQGVTSTECQGAQYCHKNICRN